MFILTGMIKEGRSKAERSPKLCFDRSTTCAESKHHPILWLSSFSRLQLSFRSSPVVYYGNTITVPSYSLLLLPWTIYSVYISWHQDQQEHQLQVTTEKWGVGGEWVSKNWASCPLPLSGPKLGNQPLSSNKSKLQPSTWNQPKINCKLFSFFIHFFSSSFFFSPPEIHKGRKLQRIEEISIEGRWRPY